MTGKLRIAEVLGSTDLLIVAPSGRRAVRVTRKGCAELVGVQPHMLRKIDVIRISEELLLRPVLAYGRFETIEEVYDADRQPPQVIGAVDAYGVTSPQPAPPEPVSMCMCREYPGDNEDCAIHRREQWRGDSTGEGPES